MMHTMSKLSRSSLAGPLSALALALCGSAQAAPKFEDSMAQRLLACTACHGDQGRAAPDGYYPRLAGKPAGYLYHQLLNFRDGRRHYGLMTRMVDPLHDAYLLEIAQHFSALDLPYPVPSPASMPAAVLQRGETLARHGDEQRRIPACVQCHGLSLTGVAPDIPGLVGLPRDYLNAQLGAWQTRQRQAHAPDCMAEIAQRMDAGDVTAVAAWLAAQPVPGTGKPAPALPARMASAQRWQCGSAPAVAADPTPSGARP
jgi:cytochrome c553